MAYALQFPDEIAGVVALAPIAFPEARLEQMLFGLRTVPGAGDLLSLMSMPADEVMLPLMWRGMFLPQGMTDAFRADFPFDVASRRIQIRADGEEAALMGAGLMRSALSHWTCRAAVKLIQGDCDLVLTPHIHGRMLAAVLPDATFTSAPGLGHMAHHSAPHLVLEAVQSLLDAHETPLTALAA